MEAANQDQEMARQEMFRQLEGDTRLYSNQDYEKLYTMHEKHWGISSPACILYRNFFPNHPYPELVPNNIRGEMLIAVNKDAVPDRDYIKYLKLHEYWEHYMRVKSGFNLMSSDEADYALPILERKRPSHRVAVLEEFQAAKKDGKLDAYMEWWRKYYHSDEARIEALDDVEAERISKNYSAGGGGKATIARFIRKNLKIREEIYNKVSSTPKPSQ